MNSFQYCISSSHKHCEVQHSVLHSSQWCTHSVVYILFVTAAVGVCEGMSRPITIPPPHIMGVNNTDDMPTLPIMCLWLCLVLDGQVSEVVVLPPCRMMQLAAVPLLYLPAWTQSFASTYLEMQLFVQL